MSNDLIDRQAAIDAFDGVKVNEENCDEYDIGYNDGNDFAVSKLSVLPSAQPTLYGYNIEHLEMIAMVLRKEDLPPERLAEILTDIGRIVTMVLDEMEESLRKAVEQ